MWGFVLGPGFLVWLFVSILVLDRPDGGGGKRQLVAFTLNMFCAFVVRSGVISLQSNWGSVI